MPADYYGGDTPSPAPESGPPKDSEVDGENEEYKTVLVPKDICNSDMKPGDTFKLRVEQVLEDQYAVKYESEAEEEEPEQPPADPAMPQAPGNGAPSLYE